MTLIEAPTRNGAVVHSQPAPAPELDATATPARVGTSRDNQTPAPRRRRRKESRVWTRMRSAMSASYQPESESAMAEADAAAKQAEKFFSGWLIVATAISIVANVAHAWLTAPAGIQIGAAIASFVPPVVLLVQTHAVFKLIKARRFGFAFFISLVVTVLIAAGAFRLSFESIRVLVIKLGTPPDLAGLWPAIIDLSIVGCTVALYALTRPRNSGEPSPTVESQPAATGESGQIPNMVDLSSMSLTERMMMWDRAASVMKERNPDVRAITERSTGQLADILRLTHDERKNQREIAEITELNAHIVRTIQRAGRDVLGRTNPDKVAVQVD